MVEFLEGTHEDGLGIPYATTIDSDCNNAGYFDLKKDPSKIVEIPELRDWPEFQGLIRSVNSDGSFFRTLRCDVWFASLSGHPKFKRLAVGYATIAFEILNNNSKDNFAELRNRFLRFAPQCSQWPETVIYFKHIPTSYNEHGIARAWSEDIEIHGMGINDKDARKAWLKGLRVVHEFLSKESLLWAGELKKGRRTLS